MERKPLTERDLEVLSYGPSILLVTWPRSHWAVPMYWGGRDGSHHSATLNKLVRHGYVARRRSAGWVRSSYQYSITRLGQQLLDLQAELKKAKAERQRKARKRRR